MPQSEAQVGSWALLKINLTGIMSQAGHQSLHVNLNLRAAQRQL